MSNNHGSINFKFNTDNLINNILNQILLFTEILYSTIKTTKMKIINIIIQDTLQSEY